MVRKLTAPFVKENVGFKRKKCDSLCAAEVVYLRDMDVHVYCRVNPETIHWTPSKNSNPTPYKKNLLGRFYQMELERRSILLVFSKLSEAVVTKRQNHHWRHLKLNMALNLNDRLPPSHSMYGLPYKRLACPVKWLTGWNCLKVFFLAKQRIWPQTQVWYISGHISQWDQLCIF